MSDPAESGSQGEKDRAGLLRAAQVRRAFGAGDGAPYAITMHVVGLLSAFLISGILWASVPTARVVPWVVVTSACHILAILQIRTYRRIRPGVLQSSRWGRYKIIQTTLLGLAWGSSVPLLYVPGVTAALLLPVIAVVAQSSTSVGAHADYPDGLYALLLSSILPAAIFLVGFAGGGQTEMFTGYALLALLGGLLATGRGVAHIIADAILARIDLAASLVQERSQRAETERARGEAEAAKEQATRFFSAVGHDLRQPVHALGLYLSLLRKDPPKRERQELIADIDGCADNLDKLFNALLGVSDTIELPAQLSLKAVSLRKLIAQTIVQFAAEAQRKGIDLRAAQSSLWVRSDEAAMARILGNLVANAIRYTEHGRVLVGVRRRRQGCALVVADTGIGIAPEEQERVFADFYQANNPERDRRKGFGLGLATVRRLCDSLGHTIALQSQPGRGSRFAVELECVRPSTEAVPVEGPAAPSADLQVLWVDDDPQVRDAMHKMFAAWDLPMRSCATGDEALAILHEAPQRRWHVLLDYRLARGENGLEIAHRLRTQCHPVPTISLVTGEADPAVLEAARRFGIAVLSKPVQPIRLRGLLATQAAATKPFG